MERIARGVCVLTAAIAMVSSNAVAEEDVFMWDGANDGKTVFWNGLAPTTSTLIWPGVTLKDVKDVFAARGGANIGGGIFNPVTLSRTDEKWEVQLQCFDLPYFKVAHLELVQKDDGVWARAYSGWYVDNLNTHPDYHKYWGVRLPKIDWVSDFGIVGYNAKWLTPILDSDAGDYKLTATSTELSKPWNVNNGVVRLRLSGSENVTINKEIRGNAALFIDGTPTEGAVADAWPNKTDAKVVLSNVDISQFTPVSGVLGGDSITAKDVVNPAFFVKRSKTSVACQFQIVNGEFLKCVDALFEQKGSDITVKVAGVYYAALTELSGKVRLADPAAGDYDLVSNPMSIWREGQSCATSESVPGYGLKSFAYRVSPKVNFGGDTSVTNTAWTEPRIYVKGAVLSVKHLSMMPKGVGSTYADVKVWDKGAFEQDFASGGDLGWRTDWGDWRYMFFSDSELRMPNGGLTHPYIYADHSRILIYGGEPYLDRVVIGNGTELCGSVSGTSPAIRIGLWYHDWNVLNFLTYGTPCRTLGNLRLCASGRGYDDTRSREMKIYGDLVCWGGLGTQTDYGYGPSRFVKSGSAKLVLMKKEGRADMGFVVSNGTVRVEAEGALPGLATVYTGRTEPIKNAGVTLAGGTLEFADGITNAIHTLCIGGDSAIDLGVNAQLDVTNGVSSALGGKLVLSGELRDDGGNLRIGRSASLTAADLAQIRYVEDGKRHHVQQLEDGGICQNRAFLLIFR